MTTVNEVQSAFKKRFSNVTEVRNNIFKGEGVFEGKTFAVAYLDCNDEVLSRAEGLYSFQEDILGADYFELKDDLRWSNYFYFLAGPNSKHNLNFSIAKEVIESDREFTRKFVLSAEESIELFSKSALFTEVRPLEFDIYNQWSTYLSTRNLGILLEQRTPRNAVINSILHNRVVMNETSAIARKSLPAEDSALSQSQLKSLKINAGRNIHDNQTFEFSRVNLIVGPNGVGKTTLLEAIEYLYCGHNRRSDNQYKFELEAKLEDKFHGEISIRSTSSSSRIKARNLAWYRKDEYQANKIVESFTRYNFLDTDAAFRISSELDSRTLADEISGLIVGTNAATLWSYLEKVLSDLIERRVAIGKQLELLASKNDLLQSELNRLKSVPSVINSANTNFQNNLLGIGWLHYTNNSEALGNVKREELEKATQLARKLTSWNNGKTVGALKRNSAKTEQEFNLLLQIQSRIEELKRQSDSLLEQEIGLKKTKVVLEEWFRYLESGVVESLARVDEIERSVLSSQMELGALAFLYLPVIPDSLWMLKLSDAINEVQRLASRSEQVIEEIELKISIARMTEARRSVVLHQLQAAAQSLVNAEPSDLCPICKTTHGSSRISELIEQLTHGFENPLLADYTSTLEKELLRLSEYEQIRDVISALADGLSLVSSKDSNAYLVSEAYLEVQDLQNELQSKVNYAANLAANLKNLETFGYDQQKIKAVRTEALGILSLEQLDKIPSVKLAISEIDGFLIDSAQRAQSLQYQMSEEQMNFLEKFPETENSYDSIHFATMVEGLGFEKTQYDSRMQTLEALSHFLYLDDETNFGSCVNDLEACLAAYDELIFLHRQSGSLSSATIETEHGLRQESSELILLREQFTHADSAVKVIEKLRKEQSLESANGQMLEEIIVQINDVFARIHSPKEFRVTGSTSHILESLKDGAIRSFDQVSTGQRAAFALSVFLALNSTAQYAPPVVLIDDPVAHIDDLNALSFLDYLRDISLNMNRQIFFATADTRLAALFEKKFAFLGTGQFSKIDLSRLQSSAVQK